jgi:hypothetical protein
MQGFAYFGLGVLALVLALFLAWVLYRLARTLGAVEDLVMTTTEEMRETLPEVRRGLGNVNEIAAGVNVGLVAVGSGAERAGGRIGVAARRAADAAVAAGYGLTVGAASLWRSYFGGEAS